MPLLPFFTKVPAHDLPLPKLLLLPGSTCGQAMALRLIGKGHNLSICGIGLGRVSYYG